MTMTWQEYSDFVKRSIPETPHSGTRKDGYYHPAFVFNAGFLVKTLDVLRHAFEVSGLTVQEWNALTPEDRFDRMDKYVDKPY